MSSKVGRPVKREELDSKRPFGISKGPCGMCSASKQDIALGQIVCPPLPQAKAWGYIYFPHHGCVKLGHPMQPVLGRVLLEVTF